MGRRSGSLSSYQRRQSASLRTMPSGSDLKKGTPSLMAMTLSQDSFEIQLGFLRTASIESAAPPRRKSCTSEGSSRPAVVMILTLTMKTKSSLSRS